VFGEGKRRVEGGKKDINGDRNTRKSKSIHLTTPRERRENRSNPNRGKQRKKCQQNAGTSPSTLKSHRTTPTYPRGTTMGRCNGRGGARVMGRGAQRGLRNAASGRVVMKKKKKKKKKGLLRGGGAREEKREKM